MAPSETPSDRTTALLAFATLGTLTTTQALAGQALAAMQDAAPDPEQVAEETLTLVATATARAVEVGLRETPARAAAVVPALLDLPLTYREYLVGGAMLAQQDATLFDQNQAVFQRLQRQRSFYTVHLPPGQFPGERALGDKLPLWMGRISPPGLPETPTDRLGRLGLLPVLLTHLRLVLGYCKQA